MKVLLSQEQSQVRSHVCIELSSSQTSIKFEEDKVRIEMRVLKVRIKLKVKWKFK